MCVSSIHVRLLHDDAHLHTHNRNLVGKSKIDAMLKQNKNKKYVYMNDKRWVGGMFRKKFVHTRYVLLFKGKIDTQTDCNSKNDKK